MPISSKIPVVSARNLRKSYGSNTTLADDSPAAEPTAQHVLDNVSVDLLANEFVVIVGPSGSGKSTLLNIIGAMDSPDTGSVTVDGQNICALNDELRARYRRTAIGFIFQSFNLIPSLTVRENLLMPTYLAETNKQANIEDYLARVGLSGKGDHWPEQLSGGEQQRVAIIRAIIHQPRLVLADEPTGNLDHDNARQVGDLLYSIVKEHETTLLLATHDMNICEYADRVLRLDSGTLRQL